MTGAAECTIAVPGGWMPDARIKAEMARLSPGCAYRVVPAESLDGVDKRHLLAPGERLLKADQLRASLTGMPAGHALSIAPASEWRALPRMSADQAFAMLDAAGRAIVAGTTKPADGIVSRAINRPISQSVTRLLLRFFPRIRPMHATYAVAMIAVIMVWSLALGGHTGLIVGALLFQVASILDGVDGEIARAAFRATPEGARADSMVDAATNIGFISGVTMNLWIQGNAVAAIAGLAGLAMFAFGLFLIGRRATKDNASFTFDGVKEHFKARRSWLAQWLIWLTMRDFFALAAVVLVLADAAATGLVAFAVVTAGWLVTVLSVLGRQRA